MSAKPAAHNKLFNDMDEAEGFVSYPERIRKIANAFPDRIALKTDGVSRTWAELMPRINQISNLLKERGYQQGDKVAVLAKSSTEYVEVFLGTLQAGMCLVPLSGMASSVQLEGMIRDCGAKMIFISEGTKSLLEPVLTNLDHLKKADRIAFDFESPDWTSYESLLEGVSTAEHIQEISPQDPFNLIYSSGTTGVPKGIEQSHYMRNQHTVRFEALGVGSETVTLSSTALYSNTTLVVFLPTLALGGKVILMSKFNAEEFLQLAEAEKVTHTMLVPVQYQRILAREDFDNYDLSHFQVKFSTSAPLRENVKADALKRWPGKLIEIYGLTEGGIGTVLSATEFPDKLASVGKPGEGVDLRIINEEGVEVPVGDIGEIVGRSDAMMTGYYNRPDLTEAMLWTSPEGDVFFKSGDMGRFDSDGFLFLLDRKKDMIISGGFNIYAADIEAELIGHPDVADVAVIGIPSEEWGETPLALVVPKEGSAANEKEIREWVNSRLGKTQRIQGVAFRNDLPRSTIGKVLKRELRDEYKDFI
ncbi:class I adenylate-forming enzyme family protein [Sneathiella sp.]|jgi:long-chain acyl-CoA synthetase|uniref:class I adenylate-forming enzyme family protein n=1 Tax=Sneathiella sp. TaxID=1964365 RepID=UPI0039E560E4